MRIGELLVAEGSIRPDQLDAGLRTQAQYGGRLGSVLVELGFVDVDVLAAALAKQLGVPAAMQKHFDAIDRAAAKLIPARTAEQRQAIPLGWSTRHAKTLIVAFADPRDLAAIDDLTVITRARIQPCIAPEARIRAALSRFYDVRPAKGRFVAVDPTLAKVPVDTEPPSPPVTPPSPRVAPAAESRAGAPPGAQSPAPVPRTTARLLLSMPPPSMPNGATPNPPLAPTPDPPPVSTARARAGQPEEPARAGQPEAPAAAPSEAPANHPSLRPVLTLDEALATLDFATDRDAVGDAIADFLAMHLRAALVLIAKDGAALGWKGFAPFVDREVIESIAVPLGAPSVLRLAYDSRKPWAGAPPPEGAAVMGRLYKLLRCEPPRTAVAVPVLVQGRVVNLVYGHGEPGEDLDPVAIDELQRVCAAAGDAYQRILRARAISA
ncbi:MAG: hypothetical protein HYV09_18815 [Deltaproteobacteria bacterium]|nr:hypothetical protein [Deltaproteobacteria bacterium]